MNRSGSESGEYRRSELPTVPASLARMRDAFGATGDGVPPTTRTVMDPALQHGVVPFQATPIDLDSRDAAGLHTTAGAISPFHVAPFNVSAGENPHERTPETHPAQDEEEANGASGARQYFHVSPPSPRSNNASGDAAPTAVAKGSAGGPLFRHDRSSSSGSSNGDRGGAQAQRLPPLSSPPTAGETDAQQQQQEEGEAVPVSQPHQRQRSGESSSEPSPPRSPVRRLTAEEEQMARLRAYNEMAGEEKRGFFTDTVDSLLPNSISKWFTRSNDVVADERNNTSTSGVMRAASAAANTIGAGAQHIGDAIENVPAMMVSVIPSAIMSDDVKQLLFTDFSNTLRGFFHTNVLSMPFVFRQAGLVGGIFLLTFVAITSEYATEAYFGAKNQLKNAHKVVLFGDVPRMTWGQWYPMLNIFYGITHLIGFIAFSASNSVVLLGAMGMKGGGARALGLIVPSLIALPLVLMKNAHSQEPLSMLSNLLVMTAVVIMFVDFPYTPAPPIKLWPTSATDFFVAMGVSVYAFTGIGSAIPIERVMAPRRYRKLLRASVALAWALLMAFGMSGFLSYGRHTCSVMTVSLQPGPLRTAVSALLFCASIMIIPLQTFPLCELSDRRILGLTRLTTYWDLKPNIMRVSYLIISAFAAFIIPYYGLLLSISGALGCGIIGLVVPAALDYVRRERKALHHGRTMHFWEYLVVFGLGTYGCVVVVIGVVSGSYQLWISIQSQSTDTC